MAEARKELKGLVQFSEGLKDIGTTLTQSVTVPLTLFAAAAVTASGKVESLKNGLQAITTQELAKQGVTGLQAMQQAAVLTTARMQQLQVVAKQPGLGFEGAVQGDVRLRAVGISAEQSAKSIKAFANAIATTGGGKSEFDRVTVQLAQLSAKGKVLAQDLRPIIEAAPAVSGALQKLYGTVDSETISKSLAKQGQSSTDFIRVLTDELAKLPQVQGGLKNGLENLADTATLGLAKIGDSISKALDLPGLLAGISNTITSLSDRFAALSPGAQKFVVALGAVVAAAGPVAVALGTIGAATPAIIAGFGQLKSAAALLQSGFAALISPTGAVVAVLATLAAVVYAAATANERAYASFTEQAAATRQLTTDISPLLDRYDQLKQKTTLSVAEQEELKSIIEKVTGVLPDAGRGFDNYGRAIDLATDKARAYIAQNQELDRTIALKSLPAQVKKLDELRQAYGFLAQKRDEVARKGTFNGVAIDDLGTKFLLEFRDNLGQAAKALEEQQKRVELLRQTIKGLGSESVVTSEMLDKYYNSDSAAAGGEGLLAALRERLKLVKEQREVETTVAAITADNKLIKSLEAQIAALEGVDKKSKKAQDAIAKLRAELAALSALDNIIARPADGLDTVERRIKTLESGLKTLLEAGVSPNAKAFREFAREALTLGQGLDKLKADTQQPFLVTGKVKLNNTLGDVIEGLRGTELADRPILLPFKLAPLKTDFGTELANVGIALQKAFSQNAASALTFGRGFNQAGADADVLRGKLQDLINQGISPLDPAFQKLAATYARTQKQAEAYASGLQASQAASSTLQQGVLSLAAGITDSFGAALAGTQSFGDALTQTLLSTVGNVAGQLGAILLASGLGIDALKVSLASFTGAGAIAAGLGLLAIAGVAKASAGALASTGRGSTASATASGSFGSRNTTTAAVAPLRVEVVGTLRGAGKDLIAIVEGASYRRYRTS